MSNDKMTHGNLQNDLPSLSPSVQPASATSQPQATPNHQEAITDDHHQQAFLTDNSHDNKLPSPEQVDNQVTFNQGSLNPSTLDDAAMTSANLSGNQTQINQKNGGHLELLEERPVVSKERVDVGKVIVTKHTRTKTVNVPIELLEEYITVQTEFGNDEQQNLLTGNYEDKDVVRHVTPSLDNKAVITINGNQVEIGDSPVEIVISRQIATVTKDTYVVQEVNVSKTTHTHTDTVAVALQHEELNVNEEGFLSHPKH